MVTPVAMESMLGYHPCSIGFQTSDASGWGQCQVGSLIRSRLRKGIGGAQEPSEWLEPFEECKGRRELDCDTDGWSRYESRT